MIKRIDRHSPSVIRSPIPLPLELKSVGYSFWTTGATYERSDANHFGLELVVRGGVDLLQNRKRYEAKQGDLFLLHRHSRHRYTGNSGSDWTHKRFVVLTGTGLDSLLQNLGLSETTVLKIQDPRKMESFFRRLWDCSELNEGDAPHRASALLYEMLLEIHRNLPHSLDHRLAPVLRTMQLNLHKNLDREDLARAGKMSYPHLNRLFKKEFGKSPIAHYESLRMEQARFYLQETSWSIKQVAHQLGYTNPLYFSTRYRQYHGLSPREHRKTKDG